MIENFHINIEAGNFFGNENYRKDCQLSFETMVGMNYPQGKWTLGLSSTNSVAVANGKYDRVQSALFEAPLRSLVGVIDEGEGRYELRQIYENGVYWLEIEEPKHGSHCECIPDVFSRNQIEFEQSA